MTTLKKGSLFAFIDSLQVVFAGLSFSFFVVVWMTGFDWIVDVFKPDYLNVLSVLRVVVLIIALTLAGLSGPSIIRLAKFVLQMIDIYKRGSKELNEIRKEQETQEETN